MEYEVGKYYEVDCAKIKTYYDGYENLLYSDKTNRIRHRIIYIPIIGPLHQDKAFSDQGKHYHIDGRFESEYCKDSGVTAAVVFVDHGQQFKDVFISIEKRFVKSIREITGMATPMLLHNKTAIKWHNWADDMVGKSCAGKKCPHYGVEMLDVGNDKLYCPLHGLIGCSITEKIVSFGRHPGT